MFTPNDVKTILHVKYHILEALLPKDIFTDIGFGVHLNSSADVFIAGGIFAATYHGMIEEWKSDVDIFVINSTMNENLLIERDFIPTYGEETPTYSRVFKTYRKGIINLIVHNPSIKKTPEEIVNDFDYLHCRPLITFTKTGSKLHISKKMFDAVDSKQLILSEDKTYHKKERVQKWIHRNFSLLSNSKPIIGP